MDVLPIVGTFAEYSWYPRDFYARMDFGAGLILGIYIPLMSRARNHDCFAAFWTLGNNLYGWHAIFDNKGPHNFTTAYEWITFLLVPTMTGYQLFKTNRACMAQRAFNESADWIKKFKTHGTYDLEKFTKKGTRGPLERKFSPNAIRVENIHEIDEHDEKKHSSEQIIKDMM